MSSEATTEAAEERIVNALKERFPKATGLVPEAAAAAAVVGIFLKHQACLLQLILDRGSVENSINPGPYFAETGRVKRSRDLESACSRSKNRRAHNYALQSGLLLAQL